MADQQTPRRYEVVAYTPEGSYCYSRSDDLDRAWRDAEDCLGEVYDTHTSEWLMPARPSTEETT